MSEPFEQLRTNVTIAAMGARSRARRIAGVSVLAGFVLGVAMLPFSDAATTGFSLLALTTALAAMLWGLVRAQPASAWREVTCRRDGLTLHTGGDTVVLPREALAEGIVRQGALAWQLRVTDREGTRYDIDVPDEQTAQRWLDALGLGADRRAARIVTNRPLLQGVFAYFFGGWFGAPFMGLAMFLAERLAGGASHGVNIALMYLMMAPSYWLAARSVGHVDLTIGADGVYAGRGWARTYLPLYALRAVQIAPSQPETVELMLTSGEVRRYRMETGGDARAVVRRIRDAMGYHQLALPDALTRVLTSPAHTTAESWRDAFIDSVRSHSYRDVALTPDDLTRVLASPSVTPEQRLGAALALRALDQSDAGSRVRVAVELVADPTMQRALAHAATPEAAEAPRASQGR